MRIDIGAGMRIGMRIRMRQNAQFFIISAVVISIVLMYYGFYSAGTGDVILGAQSYQGMNMDAVNLFNNVKEVCRNTVDITFRSGGDIDANLLRLKNFMEDRAREQNYNLTLDYDTSDSPAIFFNLTLSSNEIMLRDEFYYTSEEGVR